MQDQKKKKKRMQDHLYSRLLVLIVCLYAHFGDQDVRGEWGQVH